ncbi:hypothetical protein [Desulfocicer vacuolatum]|uniref:hypothetical protein n=1 Tax=Desulfocicer vacuolatum TaxID=2298 RepID=UPI001BB0911F|nr:hypothetical protein [Desulfocicer vacuolatum]
MKYPANPGNISTFVVGGTRSEYGPPVAVYMKEQFNLTFFHGSLWAGQLSFSCYYIICYGH